MIVKWKRIKPGVYRGFNEAGDFSAMVERGSIPWMWWWAAWSIDVDGGGTACSFAGAKSKAANALATTGGADGGGEV